MRFPVALFLLSSWRLNSSSGNCRARRLAMSRLNPKLKILCSSALCLVVWLMAGCAKTASIDTSGSSGAVIKKDPVVTVTDVPSVSLIASCPAQVVISDSNTSAAIYYTLDGSTPSSSSTRYSGPISLGSSATVQIIAMAKADGLDASATASASYTSLASAPTFFPLPGPYTVQPGAVTISSTDTSATIHYTLDGSTPSNSSPVYSSAVTVSPAAGSTQVLRAIAVDGSAVSCASEAAYSYIPPSSAQSIASVVVDPTASGTRIPDDFAGLSQDHNDVARWVGPPDLCGGSGQLPCAANSVYRQLLNNLISASGSTLFLRVEGDGAMAPDNTNYGGAYYNNCSHSGATFDYAQTYSSGDKSGYSLMGPLKSLLASTDVKVSLGIDMACNQESWASTETANYVNSDNGLGSLWSKVVAIEPGNEPDNYLSQSFRCTGYTFNGSCASQSYLQDWKQWVARAQAAAPSTTLKFMGPSTAGSSYIAGVQASLGAGFNPAIISQHNYPIAKQTICTPAQITAGSTSACNLPDVLLQQASVYGAKVGPTLYQSYLKSVRAASPSTLFRMGEFGDIGGGGQAGLSNTFQAALWLLDVEFLYASLGYDGTNLHTGQYTNYNLWEFTSFYALKFVQPRYYGLLMFDKAAGHGARLVPVKLTTSANLSAWATIDAHQAVHVVIINKDESATGTVQITVPGYSSATTELLSAPSYSAQCKSGQNDIGCSSGVSLGTTTFDGSTTGSPVDWAVGHSGQSCPYAQQELCAQQLNASGNGVFTVTVPITSALHLTVNP